MKRILFITNNNPLSVSYGAEQRSHIFLEAFLGCGCEVDIAYIGTEQETYGELPDNVQIVFWHQGGGWQVSPKDNLLRFLTLRMMPKCQKRSPIIKQIIDNESYDYIFCRYIYTAAYAGLWPYRKKLLLDVDDMPDQAFATLVSNQKANFVHRAYHRLMKSGIKRETRKWLNSVQTCFLPDKNQAKLFNCKYAPNIPIVECDNPIFIENNHTLLFVGLLSFPPNHKGITAFLTNCWNLIIQEIPNSKLVIAGKGLSAENNDLWMSYRGVEVLGYVENIYEFYEKGNIFICPVFAGAGTNIKVAEAMTLGKACVVTSFSSRGYEELLKDGVNSCVSSDWDKMKEDIIMLLRDEKKCRFMCEASFSTAKQSFSRQSTKELIQQIIDTAE